MQTMYDVTHRGGLAAPGEACSVHAAPPGFADRARALVRGPWGRPLGKAAVAVCAVAFLSWLGARSAEPATSPGGDPDPRLEALVTMAAAPTRSARATEHRRQGVRDAGTESGAEAGPAPAVLPDGRIVLNVADEQDLCRLRGIGPSRAGKIVALRERLGRFRAVRQLLRIRGIGPKTLKRLRPRVVLDPPSGGTDAG